MLAIASVLQRGIHFDVDASEAIDFAFASTKLEFPPKLKIPTDYNGWTFMAEISLNDF